MYNRHDFPPEDLIDKIYEAPLATAGWKTLVPHLECALGGRVAIFVQSAASVVTLAACSPSTDEHAAEYEDSLWPEDLAMQELRSAPVGRIVVDGCSKTDRRRDGSKFYGGYLKALNAERGIYASVHRDRNSVFIVSARRSTSAGEFTDRECRTLTHLTPHFERSFKAWQTLSNERQERAAALTAMNENAGALMLVDRNMHVHFSNNVARERLNSGPLTLTGGRLTCSSTTSIKALRNAIQACTVRGMPGLSQRLTLEGMFETSVMVTPLGHGAPINPEVGPLAVLTFDASEPLRIDSDVLRGLFALTPSETRLLEALVSGERLSDYSRRAGISITTTKSHLNALFAKTGTRRQMDLVRHALSIGR